MIDEAIISYGTEHQQKVCRALNECKGNKAKAARLLGLTRSSVRSALRGFWRKVEKRQIQGLPTMAVGNSKKLGKITTQIDKKGNVERVWYRQDDDYEKAMYAIEEFCKTLPKIKTKKPKGLKRYNKDVIPFFQIGDGHLGMLSYRYEVGSDFDLDIAERDLCTAMAILIDESPDCERCVIQDMGDMTHYENELGQTEASGHDLDCDGRYNKMISVYTSVMRFIIEYALNKFRYVDVIINQGNHSRKNDHWMAILLRNVYENEKRLTTLNNQNVFIPYRMGNTFVMCHHSDKCKPNRLAHVMATDYRHDFGEALYKYVDIGHVHHNMVLKEHPGVVVESFNQLATTDKYAHDGGWRSRSCLTVVYRSKTYGEIGRNRLPLERVRDIIENVPAGTNANVREKVYTV